MPAQARRLCHRLIAQWYEIARDNGVNMLYGEVPASGLLRLGLMKKTGFSIKAFDDGVRRVEMPLAGD